jgi:hypothetical protein
MTAHIDYPSTYREREREEVVKKNEHDSSKPPVSEGGNQYSLMSWKNQADFDLLKV